MIGESQSPMMTLQQRVEKELSPLDPKMVLRMMSIFKLQPTVPGPGMVSTLASAIIKCLKPVGTPASPGFIEDCVAAAIRCIDRRQF